MKNAEGDDILISEGKGKNWNYHPNLPLANSPIFRWPPRISYIVGWIRRSWFNLSATTLWVLLAIIINNWFQPSLIEWRWVEIGYMLVRNLLLICCVAGTLHFWLWSKQIQGKDLRFDSRNLAQKNRVFKCMYRKIAKKSVKNRF